MHNEINYSPWSFNAKIQDWIGSLFCLSFRDSLIYSQLVSSEC